MNETVRFEEANETNDSSSLKWIANLSETIQHLSDYIKDDTNFKNNPLCTHMNYQKSVSLRISKTVNTSFPLFAIFNFRVFSLEIISRRDNLILFYS